MTTKPKTRKAPAAKPTGPEESCRRDEQHPQADCAAALPGSRLPVSWVARSVALNVRHREERDAIIQQLAKTVPDCLDEAMALLKFATSLAKSLKGFDDVGQPTIAMLKNAATGFFKAHVRIRMDNALERFHERRDYFVEEDA
jgi:hypothetical protein